MEETPTTAIQAETAVIKDVEGLPLLLGMGGYKPTVFQAQAVYLFLISTENKPIHQIVGDITYDASLWYKWKKKPGFMEWFDKVCHSTFSTEKLLDVHAAVYRRAMGNSPADAKLFLQRFDKNYVERTQQDQRLSFQGYEPADADSSRDRQRKAIASRELALPVPQDGSGSTIRALPIPKDHPTQAIQGVGAVYAGLARAIQAQVQQPQGITEHTRKDNDISADSKPITQAGTPGGGFE